jgi:hypothetical protein
MNRLFNTRKVIWQDNQYIEVLDDIENDEGNENISETSENIDDEDEDADAESV